MRIGILTTSFPRFDGDPAGHFVLGCARALVALGHECEVLAPEPRERLAAPAHAGVALRWVPYLRPRTLERTFYGSGVPDNLRTSATAWLGLAPFVASLFATARRLERRWDAIVSHWALPCALVAGAIRRERPHLVVCHSADVHALRLVPARAWLARTVVASSSTLLFSSNALRATFLGHLEGRDRAEAEARSTSSAMGIDAPEVPRSSRARAEARARLGVDGFVVASLSRLVPIKGLDVAAWAAAQVPGTTLVIAGEGPERERLAALAAALPGRVRLLGRVAGDAKSSVLAAADAFVAPSRPLPSGRTEGAPTALLEAMAAGVPVVASATGGIPELVEQGRSGLLVPPGDRVGLAAALSRLGADADLRARLGDGARETARAYAWPVLGPWLEAQLRTGRIAAHPRVLAARDHGSPAATPDYGPAAGTTGRSSPSATGASTHPGT